MGSTRPARSRHRPDGAALGDLWVFVGPLAGALLAVVGVREVSAAKA
jgi:hypothetical protein